MARAAFLLMMGCLIVHGCPNSAAADPAGPPASKRWTFERIDDRDSNGQPDGFTRRESIGFPRYVDAEIVPRDPKQRQTFQDVDAAVLRGYQAANRWLSKFAGPTFRLPWPPSLVDLAVDHYYRIDLDGGQFQARTNTFPADADYRYTLSCDLRCEGLLHDRVSVELVFLDSEDQTLRTIPLGPISGTKPWRTLVNTAAAPTQTTNMFLRLSVLGGKDGLEDIRGRIGFDNLSVTASPQLKLTTDQVRGVYLQDDTIVATAAATGTGPRDHAIEFVVTDALHREVLRQRATIRQDPSGDTKPLTKTARWTLPPLPAGAYHLSAQSAQSAEWANSGNSTPFRSGDPLRAETTFAVLDPRLTGPPHGVFGWTLQRAIDPQDPAKPFAEFLRQSGAAWLKYPCWIPPRPQSGIERLLDVLNQVRTQDIQTVGMLDRPPINPRVPRSRFVSKTDAANLSNVTRESPTVELRHDLSTAAPARYWTDSVDASADRGRQSNRGRQSRTAAGIVNHLREIDQWQPDLSPVMSQLTVDQVRWQLGRDDDYSFLQRGSLQKPIEVIAEGLRGFGQPLRIALPWPWTEPTLGGADNAWQTYCLGSRQPMSAPELDAALSGLAPSAIDGGSVWVSLQTIPADRYTNRDRIIDLVSRMIAVKSHPVTAAFLTDADAPATGIVTKDGRPGPLYLPFRTTSRLIGNLRRAGSLDLQPDVRSSIFIGKDTAVLILSSPQPDTVNLYLGEDVQIVDVWGRIRPAALLDENGSRRHTVQTGPLPIFIINPDPVLLAFRTGVRLSRHRLDAVLGENQSVSVQFTNPTADTLTGEMRVEGPRSWHIQSDRQWQSAPRSIQTIDANVVLSNTVKIGDYRLPLRFDFDGDPQRSITEYRSVSVGARGLKLRSSRRILPDNRLRVRIEMTNTSVRDQRYDCLLFPPPGRRYQMQTLTIQPGTTTTADFYWRDATDLLSETMLLRAVQQDGDQVLNYDVPVEDSSTR